MVDYYLGRCYEDDVIKGGDPSATIDILKEKMAANQSLLTEAQSMLASYTDAVTKRCFVSKKKRDYLTKALGE
ncbi:MAG: hypothetical protein KGL39_53280 [Patescibacteria group bacterium]|nr:hypothetical protein [Patescibacteria group bacterium]